MIKCFNNYIPIFITPNILKKEDIDIVIEEVVNKKTFEKSDTEIETYESIEKLKFRQEFDDGGINILDDLNEKGMEVPLVQAMFRRSKQKNLSIFIISQDYYELPKRMMRANGIIYYIFKPNRFRDVQKFYQDEALTDMTLNEYKYLTSTCWNENHQPLTTDMTKGKFTGQNRLELNSIFVPDSSPF